MSKGLEKALVVECSWEVCNQIGGIYTVLRSKVPAMKAKWGDNYALLGPLANPGVDAEFEDIPESNDPIGRTVLKLRSEGLEVRYGRWLVTGRPKVVLIKPGYGLDAIGRYQKALLDDHGIECIADHDLQNQMILWAQVNTRFFKYLAEEMGKQKLIAHFHEWMASLPILELTQTKVHTVFTTHATMLGRYLAGDTAEFYENLHTYNWYDQAKHYGIVPMAQIERFCAHAADSFTTVSEMTALECKYLLGKEPDEITPNGLNIQRFAAMHEVQNLHQKFKEQIHKFTIGHFFHSYPFDLDNTLYFFTSGRYEYSNKGYDITLDALKRLNVLMQEQGIDTTVIMFIVTKRDTWSINPEVLQSRGEMREINKNVQSIMDQLGDRLFMAAVSNEKDHRLPDLNELVDDYWKLRYRRTIQSWKQRNWPIIVTHNLVDEEGDQILGNLKENQLFNSPSDRVKVVYHPQFIESTNPLFGMDYGDFVRGCHLGIFPSYYEPWGYTPLESIARGVPTVTSDLSGFGKYVNGMEDATDDQGIYVLSRQERSKEKATEDLANYLLHFVKLNRRYRIIQRNKAEDFSERFDWGQLRHHYEKSYEIALSKRKYTR